MVPSYIKGPLSIIMIGVLWTPIVFSVGSLFYSFTDAPFAVAYLLKPVKIQRICVSVKDA